MASVIQSHLPSEIPIFLMGHSMGGAEVLQFAARGPLEIRSQISGYLAESPWIALHPASQPWRATVLAGRVIARVLPKKQLVQKLDASLLSRDERVCKEWAEDELCHDTSTLEGLAGMLQRAEELDQGLLPFSEDCKVWVGHGTADRVTSYDASEKFVERSHLKDKEFKAYGGWYHKRGSDLQ